MAESDCAVNQIRLCTGCGETKPYSEFYFRRGRPVSRCKQCHCEQVNERRRTNRAAGAAYTKAWRLANKERADFATKAWNEANRDHVKRRKRKWAEANRERLRELRRASDAKWRADPVNRIKQRVRARIRHGLATGAESKSSQELLGYTYKDLRNHLERQFLPGMSWENMGKWHIDHIVPLSSFSYQAPEDRDFRRAWCMTNLRPLWAEDNFAKNNKIETLL